MVMQNWQLDGAYIDGLPTQPLFARVFGQARETDAASLLHCSFNMVKDERGAPVDRVVEGAPTVRPSSFRFGPGDRIRGLYRETQAFIWYVLGWSDDTDIGAVSSDRAPSLGNFRASAQRGSALYALTNSAFRLQTYDVAGSLYTTVLNIPPASVNLPRIISAQRYLDEATWKTSLINHSGDSTGLSGGNTPPPVPMAATPAIGAWPIGIGSAGPPWAKHFDNSVVLGFPEMHDTGQQAEVLAIIRAIAAQLGVTELAI